MDDHLVALLARASGLEKALSDYPDDVAAAARNAASHVGVIKFPADPADEPWPSMDVSVGRTGVSS